MVLAHVAEARTARAVGAVFDPAGHVDLLARGGALAASGARGQGSRSAVLEARLRAVEFGFEGAVADPDVGRRGFAVAVGPLQSPADVSLLEESHGAAKLGGLPGFGKLFGEL